MGLKTRRSPVPPGLNIYEVIVDLSRLATADVRGFPFGTSCPPSFLI